MASQTDICNRALQRLGAARIRSLNDGSPNARHCLTAYDLTLAATLRAHPWNFSIVRHQLAASATAPLFGRGYAYPLPVGWLRVLPPDAGSSFTDRDWIMEGNEILSDETAPLNVRCVMLTTDTTKYDPCFIEAFAARLAGEMCEAVTQSTKKLQGCYGGYKEWVAEARKTNAIEKVPVETPEDSWLTIRRTGNGSSGWPT